MVPQWIIEKKRDGGTLTGDEIHDFIADFTAGKIPDYQMAALAMAIFFRGMTPAETAAMTDAMMRSGDLIDWKDCSLPTADKHSTGGIGDKLSLMIAPLVATQGVAVPMVAGRGLGITGGTIDKLESIPGYNTHLDIPAFKSIVEKVGCSITGQTATLAPADKKLYALRDVTGTVQSIPLITASIMSKKLAEGADSLVFDVKCGNAAFMKRRKDAEKLRDALLSTSRAMGRKCAALITSMDQPLGRAVGNAVEIAEAVETLQNKGPADTRALTLALAQEMVFLSHPERPRPVIADALACALSSGLALERFAAMVEAQGGNPRFIDHPESLPQPGAVVAVPSPATGCVESVDAEAIGRVVLQLGGNRKSVTDTLDLAAGVDRLVQTGEDVEKGQPLMRLLAKDIPTAQSQLAAAAAAVHFRC